MRANLALALVPVFAILTISGVATATETDSGVITTTEAGGYGYRFHDDLLGVGLINSSDPKLHVVQHAARSLLIRPRTQFIGELLKSVENP